MLCFCFAFALVLLCFFFSFALLLLCFCYAFASLLLCFLFFAFNVDNTQILGVMSRTLSVLKLEELPFVDIVNHVHLHNLLSLPYPCLLYWHCDNA